MLAAGPARADCRLSGIVVICAPPGTGGFTAAANGLIVHIDPNAQVVDNASPAAISINRSTLLLNYGTVSALNANIGILINDDNNTVINHGNLVAGGNQTTAIRVAGTNNDVTNARTGIITVSGAFSTGILGNIGGNRLVNEGTIIVSGLSDLAGGAQSVGIVPFGLDIVVNTGAIHVVSAESVGILATNGTPLTLNYGSIVASGATSFGIFAGANGTTVNYGSIVASGANSVAVALQGNKFPDAAFINNGVIIATGAGARAITTRLSSLRIDNNGLIDGRIFFTGNGGGDYLLNNGTIQISTGPLATHTLTFGLFEQGPTGTFVARVNNLGASDRLVADLIDLRGGTLRAAVLPGLYAPTTTYLAVLEACGACGLVGRFATVTSSSPFFTASAIYNTDTVDLILTRTPFHTVAGLTPNQLAVALALEPSYSQALTGNAATLFANLLAATSVNALDQLSGQGYAAVQNANFDSGSQFTGGMLMQALNGGAATVTIPPAAAPAFAAASPPRGHEAFAALKQQPAAEQPGRWRLWTLGFAAQQRFDGESNPGSANQSTFTAGGSFGVDRVFGSGFTFGAAVGGSASTFTVNSLLTTGSINGGHFGAYVIKNWGAFYAAGSVSYAHFENSTVRTVIGIGPTENSTARFGSDLFSSRFELGWRQAYGWLTVTPFAAVQPAVLWQSGFTETNAGLLGLTVASRTTESLPTFVGAQFQTAFVLPNGATLTPFARLSWVHEFMPNRDISATLVTIPAAGFTVGGARPASDAARLDAGARLALRDNVALFANMVGELSDRGTTLGASGGIRALW